MDQPSYSGASQGGPLGREWCFCLLCDVTRTIHVVFSMLRAAAVVGGGHGGPTDQPISRPANQPRLSGTILLRFAPDVPSPSGLIMDGLQSLSLSLLHLVNFAFAVDSRASRMGPFALTMSLAILPDSFACCSIGQCQGPFSKLDPILPSP